MRAFVLGLLVLTALSVTVLSIRPGGLRSQLRLVGRRFRLVLALGAVYVIASAAIRVFFPAGVIADYGPAAMAIVLGAVFLVMAQDPALPPAQKQ
jgi:hypothetical protein